MKAMFESSRTYGLFTTHFNAELYHYAASSYINHAFGRERRLYTIVGVAKVLENVEISQRNRPLYDDMRHFCKQDFAAIYNNVQIPSTFKPYLTARIDIELLTKTTEDDFQIISVSDERATVAKPEWLQRNGSGYMITSCMGQLKITAKIVADGQIRLRLRGLNVRNRTNKLSKRIPYWIDYTRLVVANKTIFDTLTPACHAEPYIYNFNAQAGDEIKIQVEWLPHRSDT